jgi:hypothetical protein
MFSPLLSMYSLSFAQMYGDSEKPPTKNTSYVIVNKIIRIIEHKKT